MTRAIRPLIVSALLLSACDGGAKAEGGASATKTDSDAASAGAQAKPDAAKPDPAKPDPAKPDLAKPGAGPALPGQPGYDCGRLLSRVEIESVCGTKLQEVTIDQTEGTREQIRCSRRWRNESKSRTISMILGDYTTAEKAASLGVPADHQKFEGVGDLSRGYVEDKTSGIFWHTVRTQKGQYNLDIRAIVTDSGEPLCSLQQLSELSREVAKRIEQAPIAG